MTKRDYYEILGINKDADNSTIKRAYRDLAMRYHPDRNPGDEQAVGKMKEINEAYAVLSDREKRRMYDMYGHAGLEGYTIEDIFRGVDFGSLFREFGLGDFGSGFGGGIFDSLFGGVRRAARGWRRGADLRYDLEVTLEEVAFGAEKKIEIARARTCASCEGTGAKKEGLKKCERCGGSGQIVKEQRSGYSVFRQTITCSDCHGRGSVITDSCDECSGKGFVEEIRELSVSIPKGANTGYKIRIEGEGEPGEGGTRAGDLYVVLNVKKHPIFERHGDDIYVTEEISFPRAALGGEIEDVPGLDGSLKLEIPEGTQTGAIFRIMNKGISHLNDHGSGDEYVIIKVATPHNLTKREKELLREFEKMREEKDRS
jgi:molecular chaperone DnaJ